MEIFATWFEDLGDKRAKARIQVRIDRMEVGNSAIRGQSARASGELRIHYGPGYRVYFVQRDSVVVVLLCGGEKNTQQADISKARELAGELEG